MANETPGDVEQAHGQCAEYNSDDKKHRQRQIARRVKEQGR